MSAQITINPQLSTNAAGSFGVQWDGLIQGTAYPDPATRYALSGGYLASTETLPMWGGVAISENIPAITGAVPDPSLGGSIIRADKVAPVTTAGALTGWSVFDQAYGMINSPQSPVPLAGTYGQVMFYRLGSRARIAVKMDPALALGGEIISTQVSWDFTNQQLIAYDSVAALPVQVLRVYTSNCMTVSYDPVTGFATWNRNGACAVILI